MGSFGKDVQCGFRMLHKNPGFVCAAILILGLGIGGVSAMFSTFYAVMIRPLPYSAPDRLVLGRATNSGQINPWGSGPDYVDYRDKSRSFSALEAFFCFPLDVTLTHGRTADRAKSLMASTGLFSTLGATMALGRPFRTDEGLDGASPVAILSHACWRKHFPTQKDLTSCSFNIDGVSYSVVGVTSPGFDFIHDVDVWLPLRPQMLGPRRFNSWLILGRLKGDTSLAQAQSEVDVIAAQLEKAYPDTNANKALLLTPLQSAFAESYRSSFVLLCGGSAAILLIAWANAAGLLLARGAARRGELAVRAAMGASQWQLMQLLLVEALILAAAAGVIGTVLAVWIQKSLLRLMPIETLLLRDTGFSFSVLLSVLAPTVLTGLGFGLLPALRARRVCLADGLRSSGRGTLQQSVRLRGRLVAGQVTVSFILLVVAGLLIRSFTSLHRVDPGFNSSNLLTVEVPLPSNQYTDSQRSLFFATLLDGVRSLPGVTSAAAISQLPIRDPYNNIGIYAADAPPTNPQDGGNGYHRVVQPGYFNTMGIPLIAGRDLQTTDTANSRRVVVISQQLVKTLFPNRDPLGQRVVIDQATDMPWEVVGVVGDVKQSSLYEPRNERGAFYRALAQQPMGTMRLAIRSAANPIGMVAPLRVLLQNMNPDIPLSGPRTMDDIMANSTLSEKAQAACLLAFSLQALILAAVGIYGLLAYVVIQRQRDIGICLALGATSWNIARSIVREAVSLAFVGLFLGGLGALGVARLIRANLYGISPIDPVTYAMAALVLLAAAMLAAWLPARRASKVNPMAALRCE
jgi:putative ABC transport system permease protein